MKNKFKQYGAIDAIKKNDDGTLIVTGFASSGGTDSDGEIITPEAMAKAIPDYMKFGAVREMHGKSAAGTAIEIEVQADGRTSFSAHIVDPIAVLKVEAGVYKGFSIGGSVSSRDKVNKSTITGLNLIEVSLVDRPANPEALITMYKADEAKAEKSEALIKGMSHVCQMAYLLKELGYLTDDQINEMQREGDGSGVPARLLAWLKDGAGILVDMTVEEAGELVAMAGADLLTDPDLDFVQFAASAKLIKGGAKFSKATSAQLADIHAQIKAVDASMVAIGYDLDADGNNDDATADADKAAAISDNDGANALAKSEALSLEKRLQFEKEMTATMDLVKAELIAKNDALAKAEKEIDRLKAQPAPAKAAVSALGGITKAEDIIGASAAPVVNPHPMGSIEYAQFVAKSIINGTYQK